MPCYWHINIWIDTIVVYIIPLPSQGSFHLIHNEIVFNCEISKPGAAPFALCGAMGASQSCCKKDDAALEKEVIQPAPVEPTEPIALAPMSLVRLDLGYRPK